MAVWKLQRLARVSSLSGEPFPPESEVVTVLLGDEDEVAEDKVRGVGFVRRDYLASEVTDALIEGAFCTWRTQTPPADPAAEKRLDLDMARQFLERLLAQKDPARDAVCMTLALLLIRKRRLNLEGEVDGALKCRWPRDKALFSIPAPDVTEADAEALQQDLMKLFDM